MDKTTEERAHACYIVHRRKLGLRIYRSNKRNKNLYVKASAPDFPGLLFLPGFCILDI